MFGAIKKKLIDFGLLEEEEELEEEVEKIFKQKEISQKEPKETLQAPKKGKIVNIHTTTQLKVVVVQPMAFEDSKEIADHLKTKKPIVVNLENIDREVAKRIIDYRDANGPFASIGALSYVSGIGEKRLEAIWDLVTVEGE